MQTMAILENGNEGGAGIEAFAVVDYGGESVEEVFVDAPLRSEGLGNPEDGFDSGFVVGMDVGTPFGVIVVDAVSKRGKEVEVEVVVGVNETGEGEGAVKVEGRFAGRSERRCGMFGGAGVFGRGVWANGGDLAVMDPEVVETLFIRESEIIEPHPVSLGEDRK
jgi:hypothetical protein